MSSCGGIAPHDQDPMKDTIYSYFEQEGPNLTGHFSQLFYPTKWSFFQSILYGNWKGVKLFEMRWHFWSPRKEYIEKHGFVWDKLEILTRVAKATYFEQDRFNERKRNIF